MLETRTKIGEGGRLIIPSAFRDHLHLKAGNEVILRVKEGELHIITPEKALLSLQEKIKKKNLEEISLVDALAEMRREEQIDEK